jgi:hypothetical protein
MKLHSISLIAVLGLFLSCASNPSNHYQEPNIASAPSKVTSIAGVVAKNAQGYLAIGDIVLAFNNSSKIEIDDAISSKADIQAGMTIEAEGELVNDSQFNCTYLATNSILRGNIDSIDFANNTLVVGETTVIADKNANMANYSIGDAIKVFGNFDSDKIFATCVLKQGKGQIQPSYTAQGPMSDHNGQNKTFQCGKYIVDYSNAKVEGTPANGGQAVASGSVANGVMQAQTVRCVFYSTNNTGTMGGWCVYGRMSNWDPSNNQFQIGSGYGCCCIYYWVDYDEWTPGIDLITTASTGANFRIEGTLTQNGGKRVVKATRISN